MQERTIELRENLVQLTYLPQALGIGRSDWSLALEPNSLTFFDGILSGREGDYSFYLKEDILIEMLADLTKEAPEVAPVFSTYHSFEGYPYSFGNRLDLRLIAGNSSMCDYLKFKEKDSFQKLPPAEYHAVDSSPFASFNQGEKIGGVFQKCMKCHDPRGSAFNGSEIPFGDPAKLREALNGPSLTGKGSLREEILERIEPTNPRRMPMGGAPLSAAEIERIRRKVVPIGGGLHSEGGDHF